MSKYIIQGGKPLAGAVAVHGAKNSILPIFAATLLAKGQNIIHNCPELSDVHAAIAILRHLGCTVERQGDSVVVDATTVTQGDIPDQLMREMRSSVIFLGAVLARLGEAKMCFPGGCELGPRPINLHLAALRQLNVTVEEGAEGLHCTSRHMVGTDITLPLPSVGATENVMLAATMAEGVTTISNAAREPEIVDLQNYLLTMGAQIHGAGSSVITVHGGVPLHGGDGRVMADRMVAATYLTAVASAGGEVELTGVDYRHLSTVIAALKEAGCDIRSNQREIFIRGTGELKHTYPIRTAPYPGFPTDAQAPLMAALSKSRGTTVFVENMFESRYRHVDELVRMGGDVRVEGRVAVVCGVERLHGGAVTATDLRGGAALVVAALGAQGTTTLSGIHHIERGYERLPQNLHSLGANIIMVP